jgi:hypothetical protein
MSRFAYTGACYHLTTPTRTVGIFTAEDEETAIARATEMQGEDDYHAERLHAAIVHIPGQSRLAGLTLDHNLRERAV